MELYAHMIVNPTLTSKMLVNYFILLHKIFSVFSLHNQVKFPFPGQQKKICIVLSFPISSAPTGITYIFSMAFALFLKLLIPNSLLPQALLFPGIGSSSWKVLLLQALHVATLPPQLYIICSLHRAVSPDKFCY